MENQNALMEKYMRMMEKFGMNPEDELPYDPDETFGLPQGYQPSRDDMDNPFLEPFNGYADQNPLEQFDEMRQNN